MKALGLVVSDKNIVLKLAFENLFCDPVTYLYNQLRRFALADPGGGGAFFMPKTPIFLIFFLARFARDSF